MEENEPIVSEFELINEIKQINEELLKLTKHQDALAVECQKAVDRLQMQKAELRRLIKEEIVDFAQNISDVIAGITKIDLDEQEKMFLFDLFTVVKGDDEISSQVVENVIFNLDNDIARIEDNYKEQIHEAELAKEELTEKISSMQRYDLVKNALHLKILETQETFAKEMEKLLEEQQALEMDTEIIEDLKVIARETIQRTMEEKDQEFQEDMSCLKQQIDAVEKKMEETRDSLRESIQLIEGANQEKMEEVRAKPAVRDDPLRNLINERIANLEQEISDMEKRSFCTPGEIKIAKERIEALIESLDKQKYKIALLNLRDMLESKGLTVTVDGTLKNAHGNYLTEEEARNLGLLEGIPSSQIEDLIQVLLGESSENKSEDDSSLSEEPALGSEDVDYLKRVVGKPLTLALAEITAKQPRDPIHYLAHWLIKYRFNQELDVMQIKEFEELTAERMRIAEEALRRMIEEESRAAILEIIMRAERIALERALAAQRAQEEEEEGLEEENYNPLYLDEPPN